MTVISLNCSRNCGWPTWACRCSSAHSPGLWFAFPLARRR